MNKIIGYMERIPVIVELRLENLIYGLLSLILLPFALLFKFIPSGHHPLNYERLLNLQRKSHNIPKGVDQNPRSAQKWSYAIKSLAKQYNAFKILDVGCGDGAIVKNLITSNQMTIGVDLYTRLDPRTLEVNCSFIKGDAVSLPFSEGFFDLIFTINSFEHFRNPACVFDECLRTLKPGGIIFAVFSPLYYSSKGLHAARRLGFPYPQLLFTEEIIQKYVDDHRASLTNTYDDTSDSTKIGPYLNKYDLHQFREIFFLPHDRYQVLAYVEKLDLSSIAFLLRYLPILKSTSPSFWSLVTSGIKVVLRKNGHAS